MPFASTCRRHRREGRGAWLTASLLTALALSTVGARGQSSAQSAPPPRPPAAVFHGQTDLVVLQVVVVDQQQRFVPELQLHDFAVYEEGVRQDVMLFASTTAPLDLTVVLDTSSSMTGRMELAQDAAINLLRSLRDGDQGSVVLFSSGVRLAQPLTADRATLEAAVRSATPSGVTALYEAVYISLHELASARRNHGGELRRQALVVLTDGDDNRSRVSFDDVLEDARRSAVTVFTILPSPSGNPSFSQRREGGVNTRFEMRQLAEETGGRAFVPAGLADLTGVYDEIASELGQQYWLAYVPPPAIRSAFRRVAVRVHSQPGLRARTRSGYYAAAR